MITAELKRKIRKLKQFEVTIRAQNGIDESTPLVWDKFFDLRGTGTSTAIYSLSELTAKNKNDYKAVVDEFFAYVYYEIYIYNGFIDAPIYDPSLLEQLGLPPIADQQAVKKKFRDLAKEHHPDKGGDPEKFITLMNIYKELWSKERWSKGRGF